ncbi:MAG TPA: lysophospholipid acyltransferase family protein [Micropepsaceae bacterium]|jgi:1-acyl-sn-glycerol-3-phosphate acyltransferase|nr:lysophospholipid acyltransferase family protein [Micropepsaceae bacterium]
MASLRASAILIVFVAVTLLGIPLQWLAVKLRLPLRRSLPRLYHRFVCRLFGVRITVAGAPLRKGVLMAANHTGWLDIPILSAIAPVSFVSKAEVGTWPFFGLLARLQRTVFIRREKTKAAESRDDIRKRLLEGDALVIFPEGTSSDGNRVLPFRSALLSAAELSLGEDGAHHVRHAPVQPVSVAYVRLHGMPMGRETRPFFAWYGDMELVPHLWEALKTGPIDVTVEFHPALTIDEAGGRKALAARCEALVRIGLVRALSGSDSAAAPHRDEALLEALSEAEDQAEEAA